MQWQIATLTANTPVGLESDMGYSLAMTPDGSAVAAGAPLTSVYPYWRQGAVYYFHRHHLVGLGQHDAVPTDLPVACGRTRLCDTSADPSA